MTCSLLKDYLDRRLVDSALVAFENHLSHCPSCDEAARNWHSVNALLTFDDAALENAPPTEAQIQRFLVSARGESRSGAHGFYLRFAAAALILLCLSTVFYFATRSPGGSPGYDRRLPLAIWHVSSDRDSPSAIKIQDDARLIAPPDGHTVVELGPHALGLAKTTEIDVRQARGSSVKVALMRGTVACSVAPLEGERRFLVDTGTVQVAVVGTRFLVVKVANGAVIVVDEGVVEVAVGGDTTRLTAGQRLNVEGRSSETGAVVPAEEGDLSTLRSLLSRKPLVPIATAAQTPADAGEADQQPAGRQRLARRASRTSTTLTGLPEIRGWVENGRYKRAEQALTSYLERHPRDMDALSLMADCLRKLGKTRRAVTAYQTIIKQGQRSQTNRARYMAGVLLQERLGNHARALTMFEDYLQHCSRSSALRGNVMVRLARSSQRNGDRSRAIDLLKRVVAEYPGTASAIEAERLLVQFRGKR